MFGGLLPSEVASFVFVQDAEVAERTLVLQKVFNRYTAGKLMVTDTQPDVSGSASFSMLVRSLISPISSNRAVFEHIVSFYSLWASVFL